MSIRDESISSRDYERLCELIYAEAGIHLGSDKKTMLEVRIKRRLKELNFTSYGQYCDYLFGHQGLKDEIVPLIDVVTTNKTDFFREPKHFDFLVANALPELTRPKRIRPPACHLERGLLHRRGALHAGHRAQRIRADPSRLSLPHSGHRHLHHRAGQSRARCLRRRSGGPGRRRRCSASTSCAAASPAPAACAWFPSCAASSSFAASTSWTPTTASPSAPTPSSAAT